MVLEDSKINNRLLKTTSQTSKRLRLLRIQNKRLPNTGLIMAHTILTIFLEDILPLRHQPQAGSITHIQVNNMRHIGPHILIL